MRAGKKHRVKIIIKGKIEKKKRRRGWFKRARRKLVVELQRREACTVAARCAPCGSTKL